MPNQIQEREKISSDRTEVCEVEGKSRKRWLPAICCGAPLLLVAAISLFGVSLGAITSGILSLAAVLACPVGMYLMMRMMNNKK